MLPYLDDWAEYLRAVEGRAPATVVKYREVIRGLATHERLVDPGELRFEDIERHVRRLYAAGYSPTSRARAITAIRGFCRYLGARGVIAENPAAALRRPRVYRREPATLRREEVERLVYGGAGRMLPGDLFEVRNRVMWYVMYIAGLRASEVGNLRLEQLRWHDDGERVYSILVELAKAASGDVRLPLDPDGSRLLGTWLQLRPQLGRGKGAVSPYLFPADHGGPLRRSRVHWLFKRRLREAGIKPEGRRLSPHTLRHSIATHLLEAGWDIKDVRDFMRHASIETTAIYTHSDRTKAARRLQRMHPLKGKRQSVAHVGKAVAALVADLPNL